MNGWDKITTYTRKPWKIVEQPDIGQWWVYRGQKLCKSGLKTPEEAAAWCDTEGHRIYDPK